MKHDINHNRHFPPHLHQTYHAHLFKHEKQAESKLKQLRHLIDEGEASGDPLTWDAHDFLKQMKKKSPDK